MSSWRQRLKQGIGLMCLPECRHMHFNLDIKKAILYLQGSLEVYLYSVMQN